MKKTFSEIWKKKICCLQNGSHFIQASKCVEKIPVTSASMSYIFFYILIREE